MRERDLEMGFTVVLMIIAASMLGGCTNNVVSAWGEPGAINVGGKVLCQDCTQGWNEWINGDKPIKGMYHYQSNLFLRRIFIHISCIPWLVTNCAS